MVCTTVLKLPLVESIVDLFTEQDLSNVRIIGAQHILETTHAMFRSLYRLGLKPENISLIGKCYSSCSDVYHEMVSDGIDVVHASFSYSSHCAFDDIYSSEVEKFLLDRSRDLLSGHYQKILVLDDGGKCISFLNKLGVSLAQNVVAIEQTSAGYHRVKKQFLEFPVINVARSPVKLEVESPMIAEAIANRMHQILQERQLFPKKGLIIGGGAIGQAIKRKLASQMDLQVYDCDESLSDFNAPLSAVLPHYALIIGCTGNTSVPASMHDTITPGTVLVSASSSDREFDAVCLRRKAPKNDICHADLCIDNILLVQSGFPINFDGDRENIHPEKIQLTIALMTAALLQGASMRVGVPSIIPVNEDLQQKILNEFDEALGTLEMSMVKYERVV